MGDTQKVALARQIAGVFGLRIAQAGMLFISSVVVARLLGPEGKGMLGLLGVFFGTAALFASLGLPGAVIYRMGRQVSDFKKIFSGALTLFLLLGVAGLIISHVLWGGGLSSSLMNGVPFRMFAFFSLLLPAGMLNSLLSAAARSAGMIRLTAFSGIVKESVYLGALAAGVLLFRMGVWGAVLALLLAEAALSLWCLWLLKDKLSLRDYVPVYSPDLNSGLLSFGLRSYAASLMQQLNYRLDVFLVNYFISVGAVGVYSVATGLSEALLMLPSAICFAFFPKVSSLPQGRAAELTAALVRRSFWLVAGAAAALSLAAGWLVPFLFGDIFSGATAAVYLLAPGIAALSVSWVMGAYFEGTGRPQYVAKSVAVGLAFTLLLDIVLIPPFGIVGAAAASSVSYVAVSVSLCLTFRRETGSTLKSLFSFRPDDFSPAALLKDLGIGAAS